MTHEVFDAIRDWLVALAGGLVLLVVNRHLRTKDSFTTRLEQLENDRSELRAKIAEICGHIGLPWP